MKKKKILTLCVVVVLFALALSSCAPVNPMTNVPLESSGKVYAFWNGLWDGWVSIPAFIINLISGKHGAFYTVNNNGGGYNFGFLIGIGAFSSGSTTVVKRSSSYRKRDRIDIDHDNFGGWD